MIQQRNIFARLIQSALRAREPPVEWDTVQMGFVALVLFAVFPADTYPAETATNGFDNIEEIKSVDQSPDADRTSVVGMSFRGTAVVGDNTRVLDQVGIPVVGPDVEDAEYCHLCTE